MGKVQPLRSADAPSRSAEREKLAAAIAQHNIAVANLERIRAAEERLFKEVSRPAHRAADEAAEALAKAGIGDAQRLAASYLGETDIVAQDAALRKAAADANSAIEQADATRAGLEERRKAAGEELKFAENRRDEALREVVQTAPEIAALIQKYEASRRDVAAMSSAMNEIGIARMPDGYYWDSARQYKYEDIAAPMLAWRSAIEALARDADASLPE